MIRILYLADSQDTVAQVGATLTREYLDTDLVRVQGRTGLVGALAGGWGYDLVFLGDPLSETTATEALAALRDRWPDLPVLVLPDVADDSRWAEWLRLGATDCVPRAAPYRLAHAVRRVLRESRSRAALRQAQGDHARLVALLRTVVESTTEGILVADLAGRIATYNRKFMSLCEIPEYVMAPMELDRVLRFLQDQFVDPQAFLNEARLLVDHSERRPLGLVNLGQRRLVQAYGRAQRLGGETVGTVFSFMEVPGARGAPAEPQEAAPVTADLLEAARAGRVVPWYLTEEELVISEKGLPMLALPPGGLPRDLPALEDLIHPDDRERFRQALERPQAARFALRLRRGDGVWIQTRWSLKRTTGGYRGIFTEVPGPTETGPEAGDPGIQYHYQVHVTREG